MNHDVSSDKNIFDEEDRDINSLRSPGRTLSSKAVFLGYCGSQRTHFEVGLWCHQ